MLNKLGLVVVGLGFSFIGGTALYDYVFEESDSAASKIFSAKTLEVERAALVATTSASGSWGRFNTIVRSNTVVSASFSAASSPTHPAGAIYQHFANSGWSVCEVPAPAAVQTFAKATHRVSVSPGKGGETYRVSFHTRYRANDADCFPSKVVKMGSHITSLSYRKQLYLANDQPTVVSADLLHLSTNAVNRRKGPLGCRLCDKAVSGH